MTNPTPLSPSAQAVLHAFTGNDTIYGLHLMTPRLAAAFCAVADQVVPAASPRDRATWSPFAGQIRAEILAIAAELEGVNG